MNTVTPGIQFQRRQVDFISNDSDDAHQQLAMYVRARTASFLPEGLGYLLVLPVAAVA